MNISSLYSLPLDFRRVYASLSSVGHLLVSSPGRSLNVSHSLKVNRDYYSLREC